jgi:glycosyltransferase involved in cell wall biosynthesis
MFKVGIIQDYIPSYRAKFFEQLRERLLEEGVDLHLLSYLPLGAQRARGDFVGLDFLDDFPQWHAQVGKRSIVFPKRVGKFQNYDALIGSLRGSSFSTHAMIAHCLRFKKSFGLWGHVRNYVSSDHYLDLLIEKKQMRLATSIFAYTDSGKDFGLKQGIESDKIFVLNNTFDLSELEHEIGKVTTHHLTEMINRYNLLPEKTVLYVGGLDSSKRIDFLASALNQIWLTDSKIKLLVIGDGEDRYLLDKAGIRGQVHFLDNSNQQSKAVASRIAKLILMPGRIGLVAVDSMALGIPIVTTNFAFHAPEFDYLVEGKSKFTSKFDSPSSFSDLVVRLLNLEDPLTFSESPPSIEKMLDAFVQGVLRMKQS